MESIQDIEADETAKAEDWETVQTRLLRQVDIVKWFLANLRLDSVELHGYLYGAKVGVASLKETRKAVESLESELQQLGQ